MPDSAPAALDCARWLALSPAALLARCAQSPYQGPGPGGQKRNRVYSGVRLTHPESGLAAESSESREAGRNVESALHRLRLALALAAAPVGTVGAVARDAPAAAAAGAAGDPAGSVPGAAEAFALASRGFRAACNPSHADYPRFACAALLCLAARAGRLSESAAALGCTASALTRFLRADKAVWARANAVRKAHGLHALKAD
jgi:hypothetical protein